MLVMAQRFDNHAIDVYFNAFAHQMTKDFVHQSLVGCSGVFEAKCHNSVKVIGVVCDEGGFVHVGCGHGVLIVTRVCIKKVEDLVPSRAVDKAVNVG